MRILPLAVVGVIASLGGRLLYALSRSKRTLIADELSRIMPPENQPGVPRLVKGSFINYFTSETEVLLYPRMNKNMIRRLVTIEGRKNLDEGLTRGKGVLLFQAHFGSFQMVIPAIGYHGYAMNQVSAPASVWKQGMDSRIQRQAFDLKTKHEYSLPVKHISITSSMRPVFRALGNNEIVGITVDGPAGRRQLRIRFLGRQALFQKGAADLAVRTGASVVPAFLTTESGLRHSLVIHPPLEDDASLPREQRTRRIMEAFVHLLEEYVYRYPDHYGYCLFMKRWYAPDDPYPFFDDYPVDGFEHTGQGRITANA